MKLTIHEIAQVVGAKNDWSQLADLSVNKIEFDSRLIEKGDIFLPLRGARDGHDFIEIAFDNGAIISFSEKEVEQAHLLVDDNLLAFQKLAKYYLEKKKDMRTAFGCIEYSHGLLDALRMIHGLI